MRKFSLVRNPVVIAGCILFACIAASSLWHFVCNAHRSARIAVIAGELKNKPEFSAIRLVSDQRPFKLTGAVQKETDFVALTNFLSSVAADVPIEIWINWPAGHDSNREPGGMIATTVGKEATYSSSNLSSVLLISFAVFLLCLVSTSFWPLWKMVCVEQKPQRDLPILVLSPFFSFISVGIIWWNLPSKGENGNLWLILFFLVINTALFTYCLYSMLKKRYRLLSSLGVFVSGLATLPEYLIATIVVVEPFLK
jgi:hypothetical protein